jgi:hypothetical protein
MSTAVHRSPNKLSNSIFNLWNNLQLCVPLKVTVSDTMHPTFIFMNQVAKIVGKVLVVAAFFGMRQFGANFLPREGDDGENSLGNSLNCLSKK